MDQKIVKILLRQQVFLLVLIRAYEGLEGKGFDPEAARNKIKESTMQNTFGKG